MKEFRLIDDHVFRYLAFLSYVISIAEFVIADGDCALSEAEICDIPREAGDWFRYSEAKIKLENCKYKDMYLPKETEELKEYELGSVSLVMEDKVHNCIKLLDLYRKIAQEFTSLARRYLESKLIRTHLSNTEFFLALLRNGKAIILEGEERTIKIPKLRVWAVAHTHPYICTPSAADMEAAEDILCDQGIAEVIVSPLCTLVIFRNAPLTNDDVLALREASEFLRYSSSTSDTSIIHELKEILRNTNVEIEFM